MKVVAISGSLRSGSSNGALLRLVRRLAPTGMQVEIYEGIGSLPHFNPDLDKEGDQPPPPVAALRCLLSEAQGVVISSPEYAHGVPGTLKNALDWLVSSGELYGKPVVLMNAAPSGGQFAQASLQETLKMMSARVLTEASLLMPFLRQRLDSAGGVADPAVEREVSRCLAALAAAATV